MAPRVESKKRKHDSETTEARKRPARRQRSPDLDSSDETVWRAKSILKETAKKYLIDWEDDSKTGEKYSPTWEPKCNANGVLIADWKHKKQSKSKPTKPQSKIILKFRSSRGSSPATVGSTSSSPQPQPDLPATQPEDRPTTFEHSQPTPSQTPGNTPQQATLSSSSPADTSSVDEPIVGKPDLAKPAVVTVVPSQLNINTELYQYHSAHQSSSPSPSVASSSPINKPGAKKSRSDFVVPDTQEPGSSSYVAETTEDSLIRTATQDIRRASADSALSTASYTSGASWATDDEITQFRRDLRASSSAAGSVSLSSSSSSKLRALAEIGTGRVPSSSRIGTPDHQTHASAPPSSDLAWGGCVQQTQTPQGTENFSSVTASGESAADVSRVRGSSQIQYSVEESPSQPVLRVARPAGRVRSDRSNSTSPVLPHNSDNRVQKSRSLSGSARSSLSQRSGSTPFATQVHKTTPLRMMESSSANVTPDNAVQNASQSLVQKLAEDLPSATRRGRTLKEIALTHAKEGTRSPSAIPNNYPFPNPPNSDRSRMHVEDFGPELEHVGRAASLVMTATAPQESVAAPDAASRLSPLSAPPDAIQSADDAASGLAYPSRGPKEYAVALTCPGMPLDEYQRNLKRNGPMIEQFCSRDWPEDQDINSIAKRIAQEMRNYGTHMDLENFTISQETPLMASPGGLSAYDKDVSPKFKFLGAFLEGLQGLNVHIVLSTGSAMIVDKLKILIAGQSVAKLLSPELDSREPQVSGVLVSIINTAGPAIDITRSADMIVALDNTLDVSDVKVAQLRLPAAGAKPLCPVLHIFIGYSIEHVESCLPSNLVGTERLQRLLEATALHRRATGKPDADVLHPKEAGQAVAAYLHGRQAGAMEPQWTLPKPGTIDIEPSTQSATSSTSTGSDRDDPVPGKKRALVDDFPEASSKRVKVEQTSTTAATQGSLAQVGSAVTPRILSELDAAALITEQPLPPTEQQKKNIRDYVDLVKKSRNEYKQSLHDLQTRFEDQTKELLETRKLLKAAEAKSESLEKKIETRDQTITAIKDERTALRTLAEERSKALQASEIPEVAELEKMKAALAAMEKERDKADARNKSSESTLDYVRAEYQKASSHAAELASENDELKKSNAELAKKASGEALKLKNLSIMDREKAWTDQVAQLKGEIEDYKVLARNLQDQVKDLKSSGRGQTRGGSNPP